LFDLFPTYLQLSFDIPNAINGWNQRVVNLPPPSNRPTNNPEIYIDSCPRTPLRTPSEDRSNQFSIDTKSNEPKILKDNPSKSILNENTIPKTKKSKKEIEQFQSVSKECPIKKQSESKKEIEQFQSVSKECPIKKQSESKKEIQKFLALIEGVSQSEKVPCKDMLANSAKSLKEKRQLLLNVLQQNESSTKRWLESLSGITGEINGEKGEFAGGVKIQDRELKRDKESGKGTEQRTGKDTGNRKIPKIT